MTSLAERLARRGQPERYTARVSQRAALHNLLRGRLAEVPGLFDFLHRLGSNAAVADPLDAVMGNTHEAFPELARVAAPILHGHGPPGTEEGLDALLRDYHDLRGRPATDPRLRAFLTIPGWTRVADALGREKLDASWVSAGVHPVQRLMELLGTRATHPAVVAAVQRQATGVDRGHLEPLLHLLGVAGRHVGPPATGGLLPAARANVRGRMAIGKHIHEAQEGVDWRPAEMLPEDYHALGRSGPLVRMAMSPTQAGALRRHLLLNQRVGGLSGGAPGLQGLLATMTPQEQALLLELLATGVL